MRAAILARVSSATQVHERHRPDHPAQQRCRVQPNQLGDGVRTPEQFARWLAANGFPSLDAAAMGTKAH